MTQTSDDMEDFSGQRSKKNIDLTKVFVIKFFGHLFLPVFLYLRLQKILHRCWMYAWSQGLRDRSQLATTFMSIKIGSINNNHNV